MQRSPRTLNILSPHWSIMSWKSNDISIVGVPVSPLLIFLFICALLLNYDQSVHHSIEHRSGMSSFSEIEPMQLSCCSYTFNFAFSICQTSGRSGCVFRVLSAAGLYQSQALHRCQCHRNTVSDSMVSIYIKCVNFMLHATENISNTTSEAGLNRFPVAKREPSRIDVEKRFINWLNYSTVGCN